MKNLFILNLKKLLKDKVLIFWALFFPIILSTIFHFVFEDVKNLDFFETIEVNYVESTLEQHDLDYLINDMLANATYEKNIGNNKTKTIPMFSLKSMTLEQAKDSFSKDNIPYLYKENEKFTIRSSKLDLYTTILESFVTDYNNAIDVSMLLMKESNYTLTFPQALSKHLEGYNNKYLKTSGNKDLDYVSNYFYTVLAMAIIYGTFLAFEQSKIYRYNVFAYAKRVKISGVSRSKLLASSILSSILVQFAIIAIYLIVATLFFGLTFSNVWLALLTIVLGIILTNITGFFYGIFFNNMSDNVASALIILVGTLGGFLAGMMVGAIKFFVNVFAKPIAYININGLISDSFLQLDFGNLTQYWYNMLALLIISIVLLGLTFYKYVKKEITIE